MAKAGQRKITGLEMLLGTEKYLESTQSDFGERVDSIVKHLNACATIIDQQAERANDGKDVPYTILSGIRDLLTDAAARVELLKRSAGCLIAEPKLIVPPATVKVQSPRRTQ